MAIPLARKRKPPTHHGLSKTSFHPISAGKACICHGSTAKQSPNPSKHISRLPRLPRAERGGGGAKRLPRAKHGESNLPHDLSLRAKRMSRAKRGESNLLAAWGLLRRYAPRNDSGRGIASEAPVSPATPAPPATLATSEAWWSEALAPPATSEAWWSEAWGKPSPGPQGGCFTVCDSWESRSTATRPMWSAIHMIQLSLSQANVGKRISHV